MQRCDRIERYGRNIALGLLFPFLTHHMPTFISFSGQVIDEAYPEEERVRTFVAFDRQESAVKTYVAMNGRFFGGRQVQASFFDEDRFARKDLAPREGE